MDVEWEQESYVKKNPKPSFSKKKQLLHLGENQRFIFFEDTNMRVCILLSTALIALLDCILHAELLITANWVLFF